MPEPQGRQLETIIVPSSMKAGAGYEDNPVGVARIQPCGAKFAEAWDALPEISFSARNELSRKPGNVLLHANDGIDSVNAVSHLFSKILFLSTNAVTARHFHLHAAWLAGDRFRDPLDRARLSRSDLRLDWNRFLSSPKSFGPHLSLWGGASN